MIRDSCCSEAKQSFSCSESHRLPRMWGWGEHHERTLLEATERTARGLVVGGNPRENLSTSEGLFTTALGVRSRLVRFCGCSGGAGLGVRRLSDYKPFSFTKGC